MNKLAGMEMFVRVVESGSFSAAAEISQVSATMVAKHIRAIEDRLPVLPGWSLAPSPMYLIYAQNLRPTAKLRSAIDFLLARFGQTQA
jgi:DNA-binding transcriptional LysR family regulator